MLINSIQPELSIAQSMPRFKGYYSLVGLRAKFDKKGLVYWEIDICDHDTCLTIYTRGIEHITNQLEPFGFIQVEVKLKVQYGISYLIADFIEPVHELPFHIANEKLIPYTACVTHQDLLSLTHVLGQIHSKELLGFTREVLLQANVMLPFLRNPASIRYHHNYNGGLLRHSIDVASRTSSANLNKNEKELFIVAGLLHDIGKVRTHTEQMDFTELGEYILHDALTLEVCAAPLKRLENLNPNFANMLRHCWTCATPNARYGMKVKHRVASLLQKADSESAGM